MKWFVGIFLSWIWIQSVNSLVVHQGVFSHLTVQISPDVPQPPNCQSLFRQIEVILNFFTYWQKCLNIIRFMPFKYLNFRAKIIRFQFLVIYWLNVKFCFFAKLILARKSHLIDILTVKKYVYFSAKIQSSVLASCHQNWIFGHKIDFCLIVYRKNLIFRKNWIFQIENEIWIFGAKISKALNKM